MPNKPDKFGIKFWLAVDVDTKHILNAIPYLSKEESRAPSQRLSDWVVMNVCVLSSLHMSVGEFVANFVEAVVWGEVLVEIQRETQLQLHAEHGMHHQKPQQ